jgi:hypothetical protein
MQIRHLLPALLFICFGLASRAQHILPEAERARVVDEILK